VVLPGIAPALIFPNMYIVRLARSGRVVMLRRVTMNERVVAVVVDEGTSVPDSKSRTQDPNVQMFQYEPQIYGATTASRTFGSSILGTCTFHSLDI
jgi:hypothetical protein